MRLTIWTGCLLGLLLMGGAVSAKKYANFHDVKYLRNNDGDTFTVELGPPGSMPEIFRVISVRLRGVDTPEKNHKCESKAWTTD